MEAHTRRVEVNSILSIQFQFIEWWESHALIYGFEVKDMMNIYDYMFPNSFSKI